MFWYYRTRTLSKVSSTLAQVRDCTDNLGMGQQKAIQILKDAARRVIASGEAGSLMKVQTLDNAVEYLQTGAIRHSRGVANLWAHWNVAKTRTGATVTIPESEGN